MLKAIPLLVLFWLVKVFEKLVNNRIVDHLDKCGLFLISSMVLGLLHQTVVSGRITRAFSRSGGT